MHYSYFLLIQQDNHLPGRQVSLSAQVVGKSENFILKLLLYNYGWDNNANFPEDIGIGKSTTINYKRGLRVSLEIVGRVCIFRMAYKTQALAR